MSVFNVISLFGGLALFLYGMRIMGDGLKRGSSSAFKKAMEKVTNNPLIGFLLGLLVTAVIQSSTATIVLTSGLVGAGLITLHQSLGIIIGANVGTTVTGQIIRLLDINSTGAAWLEVFKPSTLAPIAAVIGILLIMAFKFRNSDTLGGIAMGFGILFTGLLNMTAAVAPLSEAPFFSQLFISLADKPVLGFLAGTGVAFTIQSSSATVGILQALSVTGKVTFSSIYSVLTGIYMGDCITTAIVCSIGAKAEARRTGVVHIIYNLSKAFIVLLGVTILHHAGALTGLWAKPLTSGGIANTHTLFNLVCAVLLLPVCGLFEKLARRIVRDDPAGSGRLSSLLESLDRTFFDSPALAMASTRNVISNMAVTSFSAVKRAMGGLVTYDARTVEEINEDETDMDTLADSVSNYLIHLAPHVDAEHGNDMVNYYMKCVSEFERIGDYAVNLTESAGELQDKGTSFSEKAKRELALMEDALDEIMGYANLAFTGDDWTEARHIEPIEEVIDDMVETLRANHLRRLREGRCNVDAGFIFLDILVNVERIADECSNIGIYTISLHDAQAAEMQHDYIRHLHQGENEQFNQEFAAAHAMYFDRLKAIEFGTGD